MENLIREAFQHVDHLKSRVQEGHYDLIGPDGEIILPQSWETFIEPDMAITMHLWPMKEDEQIPGESSGKTSDKPSDPPSSKREKFVRR